MAKAKAPSSDTAVPVRNFTISLAERVRAMGGAPAYITRKREIEDIEDALVARIVELLQESDAAVEAFLARRWFHGRLARLNALIAAHNRYYPTEANLPMDPRSGALLERGAPWQPLEPRTHVMLVARAKTM